MAAKKPAGNDKLSGIEKSLNVFLDKEKQFMIRQKELEKELADTIQAEDEIKVFEKLRDNGKKLDDLDIKIQKLEEKIAEIKYNIESRWPYEIYGLISKEKLYEEVKNGKQ